MADTIASGEHWFKKFLKIKHHLLLVYFVVKRTNLQRSTLIGLQLGCSLTIFVFQPVNVFAKQLQLNQCL